MEPIEILRQNVPAAAIVQAATRLYGSNVVGELIDEILDNAMRDCPDELKGDLAAAVLILNAHYDAFFA